MELFLFGYNILTAYLFGYAVFFIVSKFFKNQRLVEFVSFSESLVPVFGLLIAFISILGFGFVFYEDFFSIGYTTYSFPGQKIFPSFYVYSILTTLWFLLPTQLFRNDRVKNSIIIKSIVVLFFIFEFDWVLIEIEEFFKLRGSKSYFSFFEFGIGMLKKLLVYLLLNFILFKLFKKNVNT
jgi:hypothetical protein